MKFEKHTNWRCPVCDGTGGLNDEELAKYESSESAHAALVKRVESVIKKMALETVEIDGLLRTSIGRREVQEWLVELRGEK